MMVGVIVGDELVGRVGGNHRRAGEMGNPPLPMPD